MYSNTVRVRMLHLLEVNRYMCIHIEHIVYVFQSHRVFRAQLSGPTHIPIHRLRLHSSACAAASPARVQIGVDQKVR